MLTAPLKQVALVAIVAGIVTLSNLGGPRLWDRDEPRNAGCAREMLQRGDLIVPTFNGELRGQKPVLLYWCLMAAYIAFGDNEFAARLPSALCAIGTVICTYLMGRRLFGPQAGVWAGIALGTSLMFGVAGRAATPDSLLIFCTTLAMTIYVTGTFRPRFETTPLDSLPQLQSPGHYFPQHWPTVLAMYAAMGLAVLAKGPVGLVLPTAVIGMSLLILRLAPEREGRWTVSSVARSMLRPFEPLHFLRTSWYMRPLTAIFAAAAIALPWYWAVGMATEGEFLRRFFLVENVARATGVMEGHDGNILYYPAAILVGFFPWSLFAVPLVIDLVLRFQRRGELHAGYVLAACWVAVYVVLFSLARTKLPSYVTPCYPALALLAGSHIDRWSREASAVAGRWLWIPFGGLAVSGVAFAVGVPLVVRNYLPGEEMLALIGLIPMIGGVFCLGLAAVRNYQAAAGIFGVTATTLATLLFALASQQVDRHQTSHVLLEAIHSHSDNPQIAAFGVLEPSWVYYSGRTIRPILAADREIRPGGSATDLSSPGFELRQFLSAGPDQFVITTGRHLKELTTALPPNVEILAQTRRFLRDDDLVLLGCRSERAGIAASPESKSSPNRGHR